MAYESRPANFHQGLSPRKDIEDCPAPGALFPSSVSGEDERCKLAERWQARLHESAADITAQESGPESQNSPAGFFHGTTAIVRFSAPWHRPRHQGIVGLQATYGRGCAAGPRPLFPAGTCEVSRRQILAESCQRLLCLMARRAVTFCAAGDNRSCRLAPILAVS